MMKKNISPLTFIDKLVRKNELGQPFALMDHQREILRLAFAFDEDGRLPYDTVIFSCPKKSGKTTLNAALTLWWALTQEPPNECLVVANDLEQAKARAFASCEGIIDHNPALKAECEVQQKNIYLDNGTAITAISSDYQGASGSNHGWVSYEEIWAVSSENGRRLFEELTSVPTRRNSVKFIATYAGFEGESDLLFDLYKKSVDKFEHPEGQAVRIHPDLPVYANREARIFCYWDHEPRMPWQTPEYYDSQRRTLRPNTYIRLHENRWTSAEAAFVTPALWDPCVTQGQPNLLNGRTPLFVGVDCGIKHDNAAVVSVFWDKDTDRLRLGPYRIWQPTPENPLDIENTVEWYLRNLYSRNRIEEILADPYQLHRSITTLEAAGIPIREFPQTTSNCTLMGQTLFDLLNGQKLLLYHAEDLRRQAMNTVAIESPRGWRIAKEKSSKKIDAISALAMACCAAIERGKVVDTGEMDQAEVKVESTFDVRENLGVGPT